MPGGAEGRARRLGCGGSRAGRRVREGSVVCGRPCTRGALGLGTGERPSLRPCLALPPRKCVRGSCPQRPREPSLQPQDPCLLRPQGRLAVRPPLTLQGPASAWGPSAAGTHSSAQQGAAGPAEWPGRGCGGPALRIPGECLLGAPPPPHARGPLRPRPCLPARLPQHRPPRASCSVREHVPGNVLTACLRDPGVPVSPPGRVINGVCEPGPWLLQAGVPGQAALCPGRRPGQHHRSQASR